MTIKLYRVVAEHKAALLGTEVDILITKGWQPLGGVAVFTGDDPGQAGDKCLWYAQAMGLHEPATEQPRSFQKELDEDCQVHETHRAILARTGWGMTEAGKKYLREMRLSARRAPSAVLQADAFTLLRSTFAGTIADSAERLIADGWELVGPVIILHGGTPDAPQVEYVQAIVKRRRPPESEAGPRKGL